MQPRDRYRSDRCGCDHPPSPGNRVEGRAVGHAGPTVADLATPDDHLLAGPDHRVATPCRPGGRGSIAVESVGTVVVGATVVVGGSVVAGIEVAGEEVAGDEVTTGVVWVSHWAPGLVPPHRELSLHRRAHLQPPWQQTVDRGSPRWSARMAFQPVYASDGLPSYPYNPAQVTPISFSLLSPQLQRDGKERQDQLEPRPVDPATRALVLHRGPGQGQLAGRIEWRPEGYVDGGRAYAASNLTFRRPSESQLKVKSLGSTCTTGATAPPRSTTSLLRLACGGPGANRLQRPPSGVGAILRRRRLGLRGGHRAACQPRGSPRGATRRSTIGSALKTR